MSENKRQVNKALSKTQALCSRGEKCAFDIRLLLSKWGLQKPEQELVIQKLYDENFLDDKRYVGAFVNDKIKLNRWGKEKVSYALKQKGLPSNLIAFALENIDENDYFKGLEKVLLQKSLTIKANTDYEFRSKLLRFASSRGFSINDAKKIVERIVLK